MGKWYTDFKVIIWAFSLAVVSLSWAYSLFATKEAMAEKEQSMRVYVDQRHSSVEHRLDAIQAVLERVDERVYQLNKRSR